MHFRHLTKDRLREIVSLHRPKGIRILQSDKRGRTGLASYHKKTIYCPLIDDIEALFIYLHECGHFHMCHFRKGVKRKEYHREEFEAELYAINALRAARVFLPLKLRQESRAYVARCIRKDRQIKAPIFSHVTAWSKNK